MRCSHPKTQDQIANLSPPIKASAMYSSGQTRREAREAREEKLRLERRKKAEDRGTVVTSEVSLVTGEADGTATTVSATV